MVFMPKILRFWGVLRITQKNTNADQPDESKKTQLQNSCAILHKKTRAARYRSSVSFFHNSSPHDHEFLRLRFCGMIGLYLNSRKHSHPAARIGASHNMPSMIAFRKLGISRSGMLAFVFMQNTHRLNYSTVSRDEINAKAGVLRIQEAAEQISGSSAYLG